MKSLNNIFKFVLLDEGSKFVFEIGIANFIFAANNISKIANWFNQNKYSVVDQTLLTLICRK